MLTFKNYITEQKNLHMEHIEDNVLNGGVVGTRGAINFLRSIRDTLAGNAKSKTDITVKWDGAPAVFAGNDPADGKFFVAKKGVFNKDPKVYKSHKDIDNDTSGDLNQKLKISFDELKSIIGDMKGVIQGDLMYTQKDLKKETIDGVSYIVFHPNTIAYAVPTNSPLAKQITSSKMGIVWHTKYSGETLESMKASFGSDIVPTLNASKSVWMTDATYRDVSGSATFTKKETADITKILSRAGKIFNSIDSKTLNSISDDEELLVRIKAFNNMKVRSGKKITNPRRHARQLTEYLDSYYSGQIEQKKTERGKAPAREKRERTTSFTKLYSKQLALIFELMNTIAEAKDMVIKKLNSVKSLNTFVLTNDGYKVTGVEGYVAIDKVSGGAVKLVDRLEFSYNNFSDEIIKGWQK